MGEKRRRFFLHDTGEAMRMSTELQRFSTSNNIVGPAGVRFEGIVYILPSPTGDGSLSLVICLEADHMEVFKVVFYDF
ncbi:hypothetical protein RHGRI_000228 [Rhododendron griersonianum]|uniref:Uncharacterized protein n=1 Tax=Rhododendron griersonianum TaxID=479676 RepID=A0AAV6LFR2_9ERIC|nr:hypothetical protein RHGRI_000228 [Rhododendron griersonianum]